MFRRKIGKRIKDLIERFDEIAAERHKFHLKVNSICDDAVARVSWRETSELLDEPQVFGRDDDKEHIINLLLVNNPVIGDAPQRGVPVSVCPILGMGGLGKTTLAQMVYNDDRITNHFEVKCWICVSEPFVMTTLLRDIILSCGGSAQELTKLSHLQNRLQGILSGKRFLLVLDDVWNEDESKWDKMKSSLACGAEGSSIIVTTRLPTVASVMGTLPTCCPKLLTEEECWSLLRNRAFGVGNQYECNTRLEAIGREIVIKCGGIPLAAKALGGLLRFKREVREWLLVRDSKMWDLPQDKESSILPVLMLSYNHLPSDSKQCFAYCSVFPKDHEIDKEKLIQLWMANGFIQCNNGRGGLELEDIGSDIFDDLLLRSFLLDGKDFFGNIIYKMHDLVHDLACSITGNECSAVQSAFHLQNTVGRSTRHFSLKLEDSTSFASYVESFTDKPVHLVLRSFLILGPWGLINSITEYPPVRLSFGRFECLRILDLSSWKMTNFPISICKLKHLRYLDVSWLDIETLPESISELKNLQTLRLSDTNLRRLPKKMNEMINLRNLYIDGCDLTSASSSAGIGRMTHLKTLSQFIVGEESGCGISELQELNHLRGKLLIKGLENVRDLMDAKSANLMRKENLRELVLVWSKKDSSNTAANQVRVEEEEVILEGLQPHVNIKSIRIYNYGGRKIPSWMMLLPNLVNVTLEDCNRCERLPPLGQLLPLLKSLRIWEMNSLKCFDDEFCGDRGFPNIEILHLQNMPNLEKLWSCSSSSSSSEQEVILFPKLQDLRIAKMGSLKRIGYEVCGNGGFPSLERLYFYGMPNLEELWSGSSKEQATLFPKLKILWISNFPKLTTCTPFPCSSLDYLKISSYDELLTNSVDVQSMNILLQGLKSVKELHFIDFEKIESMPIELLENLTQVENLSISFCGQLVSLPNRYPNLVSLDIFRCPEMKFLGNDFQHLTSLQRLEIRYCSKLTSLPASLGNLTGTLQYLKLEKCLGLTSLPEWIGSFTMLRSMELIKCVNLKCLPEGLKQLTSLKRLLIDTCHPDLHTRCRENKGEDWHKISHIPDLFIYNSMSKYNDKKKVKLCTIPQSEDSTTKAVLPHF